MTRRRCPDRGSPPYRQWVRLPRPSPCWAVSCTTLITRPVTIRLPPPWASPRRRPGLRDPVNPCERPSAPRRQRPAEQRPESFRPCPTGRILALAAVHARGATVTPLSAAAVRASYGPLTSPSPPPRLRHPLRLRRPPRLSHPLRRRRRRLPRPSHPLRLADRFVRAILFAFADRAAVVVAAVRARHVFTLRDRGYLELTLLARSLMLNRYRLAPAAPRRIRYPS